MSVHSLYLSRLSPDERIDLERRLLDRQSKRCFLCDAEIDLTLHKGDVEIDHVVPLAARGEDGETNFALTHSTCNRKKGASDLRVARRLMLFERIQFEAMEAGARGANLGHLLTHFGGAKRNLRLKEEGDRVRYALSGVGDERIREASLYEDPISKMKYFFAVLPIEYVHHDDRINPRNIGANLRGLIEEFQRGRPQLHVGLTWWAPDEDATGPVKMFDGQHKAAAQVLLDVRQLPVRVFVRPDVNVLLQTNANAGDTLRQVAFDAQVKRHLGSTLYTERVREYQRMKNISEDDYSFTEADLVNFFRGEHREVMRYILDDVRDSITHDKGNGLISFVQWSGKGTDRPLAYSAIERTFYSEFLYGKPLSTGLNYRMDEGENPRQLEKAQMIRLMSLVADVFLVGQWDVDRGGHKLEHKIQHGEQVPEPHLRAFRATREEICASIVGWIRHVIENYYAFTGVKIDKERLFHRRLPEEAWARVDAFLRNVHRLPFWIDKNLSRTVFGAKQSRGYWDTVFETGRTPTNIPVCAAFNLVSMIATSR